MLRLVRRAGRVSGQGEAISSPSILIISVEGLGDTILTVPLLRAARRACPGARITLVTASGSVALFRHCPYVDEVVGMDRAACFRPLPRVFSVVRLLRAARFVRTELGNRHFDIAINADPWTNVVGAAFLAWYSGAAQRICAIPASPAVSPRCAVNRAEEELYSTVLTLDGHRIRYSVEMARHLWSGEVSADLELWPSADDEAWAMERLAGSGEPLIALGIGGSVPKRIWPAAAFVAMARELAERMPCRFAVLGSPQEAAKAEGIAAAIGARAFSLCREDVNRSLAVLGHAHAYFGNDTGSMHLAAARGVPCLVTSCHPRGAPSGHLNAEQTYHPWNVRYRYLRPAAASEACRTGCVAEAPHCILGIGPAEAAGELAAFLSAKHDLVVGRKTADEIEVSPGPAGQADARLGEG